MKKITLALIIIILFSFKTNEVTTVSIKITVPQAEIILKALSKLPYEESAQLIADITNQAQRQLSDSTKKK